MAATGDTAVNLYDLFSDRIPAGVARLARELDLTEAEILSAALVRGLAHIDAERDRAAVMREAARPVHYLNATLAALRNGAAHPGE